MAGSSSPVRGMARVSSELDTSVGSDKIVPEGTEFPAEKDGDSVLYNTVDNGYFETMGVPFVRGRIFRTTDTATSPRVAVINQAMADRYWPNRDAIGRRFDQGLDEGQDDAPAATWVQRPSTLAPAITVAAGSSRSRRSTMS